MTDVNDKIAALRARALKALRGMDVTLTDQAGAFEIFVSAPTMGQMIEWEKSKDGLAGSAQIYGALRECARDPDTRERIWADTPDAEFDQLPSNVVVTIAEAIQEMMAVTSKNSDSTDNAKAST